MDAAYKRTSSATAPHDDHAAALEHAAFIPCKKVKTISDDTALIFSIDSHPGALQDALAAFKDVGINLKHIESRPAKHARNHYEFFVVASEPLDKIKAAIVKLQDAGATSATILDTNPNSDNPTWFPRKIRELDIFVHRVLDAGRDLQSDHPGFTDKTYRERRAYFADMALEYRHGQPIPHVQYTEAECKTWGHIFSELTKLYPTHACAEFNEVFPLLIENCGYRVDNVPQLEDISRFLHESTGFRLRPVAGLLSSRDFLAGLAFRVFHSTQYIRHASQPLYTPEPDLCHEILGHVPLFASRAFAEFSQEIGLASLGASDDDIKRLATLYWFTVEFGICRQGGELKAYGAGLLSSFGELQYCLTDKPQHRPFEPALTAEQDYPITEYQPVYFVAESFEDAKQKVREFANRMARPFIARYNPYTECIELLDNASQLKELAISIQTDMTSLVAALSRRT